jgi:hypothetical protein
MVARGALEPRGSLFSTRSMLMRVARWGRSSLNQMQVVHSHQQRPLMASAEIWMPMGGKEKGSCRRVQAKTAVSNAQITQLVKMQERAYIQSAWRESCRETEMSAFIIVIVYNRNE